MNRRDVMRTGGAAALLGIGTSTVQASGSDDDTDGSDNTGPPGRYRGSKTLAAPDLGGFDRTLLFLMEGKVDGPLFKAGRWEEFHKDIMGRSDGEIQARDEEVVDFYDERFGINFDADDLDDNFAPAEDKPIILFRAFMDPDAGYRAYVMSGEEVPEGGANVRDGAYVAVVDPENTTDGKGVELGGNWGEKSGRRNPVPPGSLVVKGTYNVAFDPGDPVVITYESAGPVVLSDHAITLNCDLDHPDWGSGKAYGTYRPTKGTDPTPVRTRMVLTFPGSLV